MGATPEPEYKVIKTDDNIELREYAPVMVAEVVTDSGQNGAFRLLFNYITGANIEARKIAMTAPVLQEEVGDKNGQKISMTAPVLQEDVEEGARMTFFLPASFTLENTPLPTNPRVTVRQEPAQKIAALRFSGYMNDDKTARYADALKTYLTENDIAFSEPFFTAGYNAPWTPWFMRRNEVMYRLK